MTSAFRRTVLNYYRRHGRDLPWRRTEDPYRILVSEVMLQQTGAERVVPTYRSFVSRFPTARSLTRASLADVVRAWQGLGYNRRAKLLHDAARVIVREHGGQVPKTSKELEALPGVGPYTAGAVMAFAYNKPVPIIETNIRTVYLHHFYKSRKGVTDKDILRHVARDITRQRNIRKWYSALMDYGTHLKKEVGNQNMRSAHYKKQSRFRGSDRQIRGAIIRLLSTSRRSQEVVEKCVLGGRGRIATQLKALEVEGFIERSGRVWQLAS